LAFLHQFFDLGNLRAFVTRTTPAIVTSWAARTISAPVIATARISAAPPGAARIASHMV
jgi:hypothetical protein